MWASVFQTFWPLTTHSSPSRTARSRERREVGSRAGLAEELAPDLFAGEERTEQSRRGLGVRVRHDRRRGEVQAEAVPPGLGELDLLGPEPALDGALERGIDAEPAEADGEVHPPEPEVVLRAAELEPVPGVVVPDQLVGERSATLSASVI